MNIPRPEHPTPQWERDNWFNLNGEWEFDFDFGKSARERKLYESDSLPKRITVPFCPESRLSGIGCTDFMNGVCYRKEFTLTADNIKGRIILHFGAVDFKSYLYINKEYVGRHIGAYSSFEFDITKYVKEGRNIIFLAVEDDTKDPCQYTGKQSTEYHSWGCHYTRTTGIWQTVWLEFVPESYIKSARYYPDIDNSALYIEGKANGTGEVYAEAFFNGKSVGCASSMTSNGSFKLKINISELILWEVGKGNLYDLELKFGNDKVKSYFGMRSLCMDGYKFKLNGKSVFQRLVLDQGFYPEGIYTAKDEDQLINDIKISKEAGFNGARLHQKVFEPRFLYHCDKEGYMVWGEEGNWHMDYTKALAVENFINEWLEVLERDFNHPSIVGWCPVNETWDYDESRNGFRFLEAIYNITKATDSTRPCIDTSGNYHAKTDIYDVHNYNQDVKTFSEQVKQFEKTDIMGNLDQCISSEKHTSPGFEYSGGAMFVSEYGGIRWTDNKDGWGYGNAPETEREFIERYKGLTDALLDCPKMFAFCYTQLYDVEQEQNGLYTYERKPKFHMDIFRKINSRKAAIED